MAEAELDTLLGTETPAQESGTEKDRQAEEKRMAAVLEENAVLFPRVLVGWRGVCALDGAVVPFDAARLAAAVRGANGPYLSAGLWRAIAEIRAGARLGN